MSQITNIAPPYLLLVGDIDNKVYAKTAFGLLQWSPDRCAGQWRFPGCTLDLGLPDMTPETAARSGARTVVVGAAPRGGDLSTEWLDALRTAINCGLDIASGMHLRLRDVPELRNAAKRHGTKLYDVRVPPPNLPVATGAKRSGKRLLTVGTDCAVGKKYTALTIANAMNNIGVDVDFRATGQTGILISGTGIPIDAVVSDFLAGAAEVLSPNASPTHWDVIEGQGSLFNPSYAGVTLGLLHGSQPDAIVLCHDLAREFIEGVEELPTPDLRDAIALYVRHAQLTNPGTRCVGISVNSSSLNSDIRRSRLTEIEDQLGLPCVDPLIDGVGPIVDELFRNDVTDWSAPK